MQNVQENVILGSRFGLSLTLNIEQYEYMIGPQSDAGIKVSEHLNHTAKLVLWPKILGEEIRHCRLQLLGDKAIRPVKYSCQL